MLKNQNFNHAALLSRAYVTFIFLVVAAFALAAFYPFSSANAQRGDSAARTVDKNFAGGGTGVIEICKAANGAGLENKLFQFRISGIAQVIEVPVGYCSSPIEVFAGPQTITELEGGRTFSGDTFSGGFSMVGAETLSQHSPSAIGEVNLRARTVQVNVAEGGIPQQLSLLITNTYAAKAYVEICNVAPGASSTVTNASRYTIAGMPGDFIVPPGACTGPLLVHLPSTPGATPVTGTIRVTQLSKQGFTLESASTSPAGRLNSLTLGSGINNTTANCLNASDPAATAGCVFNNPAGGFADVAVVEGGAAQTTGVNFNNRVEPARLLKICKIAERGAGVEAVAAMETWFTFDITVNGEPEARVNPVTVQAGEALNGGFCAFVQSPYDDGTGSFRANSSVTVTERAMNGFVLSSVSSPTGAISSVNLAERKATMTLIDGVNILTFTSIPSGPISTPNSAGTDVAVKPTTNLSVNFGGVTTAGNTTVTVVPPQQTPSAPSNFTFSGSTLVYQITTSAVSSGNITVSFDVPNVADVATCRRLRILRYTNQWDDSDNAEPQYNPETRICTVSRTVANLSSAANTKSFAPTAASVFAVAQLLAPTAANVSIGGRVVTESGRGIRNVVITMTDSSGTVRTAATSSFGYYRFNDVAAGETYILTARGKRVVFDQSLRVLNAGEDVQNADFIGTLK